MKEYLSYIVSVLVALITGFMSYLASSKKCRTDIMTIQENNKHEIDRLMEQHKLDIDSLERKHQMEIEKIEIEHRYQFELKDKEMENALGQSVINSMVEALLQTPEGKQAIGQAFRGQKR